LVVGCVAESNAVTSMALCQLFEKPITQLAGGFLDRPTPSGGRTGKVKSFNQQGNVSGPTEGCHERFIFVGFMAAESVIDMHGRQPEMPAGSETMEAG
jgi:hypothetical protein